MIEPRAKRDSANSKENKRMLKKNLYIVKDKNFQETSKRLISIDYK